MTKFPNFCQFLMRIIAIKFTKKFDGVRCAEEVPGLEPAFPGPMGKQFAQSDDDLTRSHAPPFCSPIHAEI